MRLNCTVLSPLPVFSNGSKVRGGSAEQIQCDGEAQARIDSHEDEGSDGSRRLRDFPNRCLRERRSKKTGNRNVRIATAPLVDVNALANR